MNSRSAFAPGPCSPQLLPGRQRRSVAGRKHTTRPRGGALSEVAISTLVRQLRIGAVPHGLRSSFRDLAAECSDAPREVCELALAHVNTNSIKAAYRRTDLFERRRVLMEQWATFPRGKLRYRTHPRGSELGRTAKIGALRDPPAPRADSYTPRRRVHADRSHPTIPLEVHAYNYRRL